MVLPLAATALLRVPLWGVEPGLAPLGPFAVAVLLFVACEATGANLYLAAFAAGITLATVSPQGSDAFARAGELISELAKNFALLAFGTLITSSVLGQVGVLGWVLAALTLLIGRPLPVMVALIGSRLDQRQRMAASWFGPKGFASVVYGLIVLESGIADADVLFALIVATVAVSIALHSTTDVPVAVMLGQYPDDAEPDPTDDARFDATTHDDGDARDRVQDRASRNPRRPMSFTTRVDATAVGRTASGRGLRTAALWGHDIQPSRRIRRSVSRLILATMPSCRRWSPSSTGDDVEAGETGGDVRAIRRIYSRICSPTRRARDPLQPSALVHRHARTSTLGR